MFAQYDTMSLDNAAIEAHKKYIDVMVMIEGSETIYVKPTEDLSKITRLYDAEGDALLAELDTDASAIRLDAGSFIILFPQDAHAPSRYADGPCAVKKIIGKVLIED